MFVERQLKQNAKEEVHHYIRNEVQDYHILYYEDCIVFSLNSSCFFQHYSRSQMKFILCIFYLKPVQKYSPFGTCHNYM